jgi:hypothetical protein
MTTVIYKLIGTCLEMEVLKWKRTNWIKYKQIPEKTTNQCVISYYGDLLTALKHNPAPPNLAQRILYIAMLDWNKWSVKTKIIEVQKQLLGKYSNASKVQHTSDYDSEMHNLDWITLHFHKLNNASMAALFDWQIGHLPRASWIQEQPPRITISEYLKNIPADSFSLCYIKLQLWVCMYVATVYFTDHFSTQVIFGLRASILSYSYHLFRFRLYKLIL